MRILTFTTLFPNAADKTLGIFIQQRMAQVDAREGNEVHVVAPIPYVPKWFAVGGWKKWRSVPSVEWIGRLKVHHPRYLLVPKVSMYFHGLLLFAGAFPLVRSLQKEVSFDCIDAHYIYPDCFAAVLMAKLLGLPAAVSARGTDINLFPSFRFLRPMIRWTLKEAQGIIAVCKALADEMVALGAHKEKVRVIGNGVDITRFRPLDRARSRQNLNIPSTSEVVVAVGGLIQRKGYHYLIPAISGLMPQHPELMLYIIGEGDQRNELLQLVRHHKLEQRVIFVGNRPNEELSSWYSAADVSCLVSSREGWPNVVLESLACGTPVVATGLWGVPEILVSPDLGIMVEQESGAIAAGLHSALTRSWNRDLICDFARMRTWNVVAQEVEQCLVEISGEIRSPSHTDSSEHANQPALGR